MVGARFAKNKRKVSLPGLMNSRLWGRKTTERIVELEPRAKGMCRSVQKRQIRETE